MGALQISPDVRISTLRFGMEIKMEKKNTETGFTYIYSAKKILKKVCLSVMRELR